MNAVSVPSATSAVSATAGMFGVREIFAPSAVSDALQAGTFRELLFGECVLTIDAIALLKGTHVIHREESDDILEFVMTFAVTAFRLVGPVRLVTLN